MRQATPIILIEPSELESWLAEADAAVAAWVQQSGFTAKADTHCCVPGRDGQIAMVLLGMGEALDTWSLGYLSNVLPKGEYMLEAELDEPDAFHAALAWELGQYQYDRYTKKTAKEARLVLPEGVDQRVLTAMVEATTWVRDLINTPASDLGPAELAEQARQLAESMQADYQEIVGDELLVEGYPMVHAVGRGSQRSPRLVRLAWGNSSHPRVALVGKGVCFDTGGLDIKSAAGMIGMKKDMGGAAHVLGLAQLVMRLQLPVYLDVIIPMVENSVSQNAYRPSDILKSRKGLTIEVGNTDAEGRLILADALAAACEGSPEVLIDFATLTGAARVAMGPDLPAVMTNDQALFQALQVASEQMKDPVWQLPLYQPYKKLLKSDHADLSNVGSTHYGGAIIAALFLSSFVTEETPWLHLDIMAANTRALPGRPKGGGAMALRAVYQYLATTFAHAKP